MGTHCRINAMWPESRLAFRVSGLLIITGEVSEGFKDPRIHIYSLSGP